MGNVQLNPDQTNTERGGRIALAAADLTDKRSRLVVGGNSAGALTVGLPAAVTALALYLLDEEGASGEEVQITPIIAEEQIRVRANGTGNAGAVLVLCDPTAAAGVNAGKVETLPATPGAYFSPGTAEEAFVDEQLVLVRPNPRIVIVATQVTLTSTNGTAGAAADLAALKAETENIGDDLRAIHAALVTAGLITA